MATADPRSGPVSLFGVSNNLQRKINAFREVIEGNKLEVRRVSKEMRSLIERKEEAIIQDLNAIWKEVNARMEREKTETQKQIQEIESHKKEIEKIFKNLKSTPVVFTQLSEAIDSVKSEMDIDIPNVKLTWRVNELEDCINRMCRCEQHRFQLKWSKCEYGNGDNQLIVPWGIATNPMNENIYVADGGNHRIQIFSQEGERIRSVKDDEMKYPRNILFLNKSIFVQCEKAILKLNESTEKKEKYKSYGFGLGGVCTDNAHIYVGKCSGMNLIVLTLDLIEENRISLRTEFCKQDAQIRDISLTQESFYILLFNSEYPIQVFSREGILSRCVVKKDCINNADCFCLDQQHNILIADCGDSKVKIFSNEGKLLTQFGEKRQLEYPCGIFAPQSGCIITTDGRTVGDKLRVFKPFLSLYPTVICSTSTSL